MIQVNGKSSAVAPVQRNLFGVSQMVRRGASLQFDSDGCRIYVPETSRIDCDFPKYTKQQYEVGSTVCSQTSASSAPTSPSNTRRAAPDPPVPPVSPAYILSTPPKKSPFASALR